MLFNAHTLALAALFSTLVTGRPFDSPKPRDVGRRDKSYSVVNVGGDASTPAPATATSVIETTKTVEVVASASTDNELQVEQRIKVFIFVDAQAIVVNARTNDDIDLVCRWILINPQPIGTFIDIDPNTNTNHLKRVLKQHLDAKANHRYRHNLGE
ncbi:hypothetical protein ACET3X_000601 [Alternaria dauci]|uniref:Uncharacterized protein n=1 Tax=Alternaria dauci TaxID=48095 RepID=A0ABR3UVA4_9PLEO